LEEENSLTNKLPGLRSCSPLLIYVIFTVIDFETMSSKQYFSPDCQNEGEDGKNGKDYEGNVAKTVSGYKCQKWSEQKPHKHKFADQGKHNFCRNPDGHKGVWCYTTARKRWEECDVPVCPPPPVKDIGQNIFVLIYILYIYILYIYTSLGPYRIYMHLYVPREPLQANMDENGRKRMKWMREDECG